MEYNKNKTIKILFIAHNFPPNWYGGVENYLKNFVDLLSRNYEYDISVLYAEVKPAFQGIKIVANHNNSYKIFKLQHGINTPVVLDVLKDNFIPVFKDFFDVNKFDIIHFHHLINYPNNLVKIAKETGAKVLFTVHDFWLFCPKVHLFIENKTKVCEGNKSAAECSKCLLGKNDETLINILKNRKKEVAEIFGYIDYLSVPTNFVKKKLLEYNIPKEIFVNPIGIEDVINESFSKKKNSKITIGYLGSISYVKNIITIAEWFTKFSHNLQLKIWGNGDPALIEKIKKIATTNSNVEYLGSYKPKNLPEIFSQIDILIIPSYIETYSIVLREAFLYETPVLASDIEVFHDVVKNRINGIFFKVSAEIILKPIR